VIAIAAPGYNSFALVFTEQSFIALKKETPAGVSLIGLPEG